MYNNTNPAGLDQLILFSDKILNRWLLKKIVPTKSGLFFHAAKLIILLIKLRFYSC